jgi:hypothetical protein
MLITLIEGLIVGVYSVVIYFFIHHFARFSFKWELFSTGILKHLLGNILQIQRYFCYFHYKVLINTHIFSLSLAVQSLFEGILFVIIGWIIGGWIKRKYIIIFGIGFILHIIAEILNIHYRFCSIHK